MSLEVAFEKLDDLSAVATLRGPLTLGTNLKIVDTQLQHLISEGVVRLVLDLTECPYADSSGLGTLIHVSGLIQAHGGAVRLCGVSERIAALLAMTHTDKLLPSDANVAASLAALG